MPNRAIGMTRNSSTSWSEALTVSRSANTAANAHAAATTTRIWRCRAARMAAEASIRASLLEKPAPHRLGHGGGPLGDAELLVDRLEVRLHRRRAEVDPLTDLGGRVALCHQLQHVALTPG